MPAVYPDYPCRACNGSHTLYFPGIRAIPDLSEPHYYTCTKLPVAMRITASDRWRPVKGKPEGAIEVQFGDGAGRAES